MSVVLGIDLGTTNSAVAYVEAGQPIRFFEVPQLVAASEVAERPGLPSFLYLPGPYDLPEGATNLPWTHERAFAVGEFARARGAEVPGRLVSSAKSWLVHERVDRTKAILPWNADDEVEQLSPVEASRRYLDHLREAWNHAHPDQPMERQPLVLTVPASFDEAARELTVRAARLAGLGHAVLLEEPLAAFYAWVSEREHTWQDQLQPGDLVLVCDIGGGTTDFSIIGVSEGEDGPELDRLAVGDHLMLGGDNMDFAVGRHLETQLMGAPGRLDPRRWNQLVFLSRQAKEAVLGTDHEGAQYEVAIAGEASRLVAGTLRGALKRKRAVEMIREGFFPMVGLSDPVAEQPRQGLTELGLPYVHDPAVTRHLARFWRRSVPYLAEATGRDPQQIRPDYVLFNGGAMTPRMLRDRVLDVLESWFDARPAELENPRLDRAVAMGAAYYARVRMGDGVRVGSGSARAYYVGLGQVDETERQAAICLVPRGAPEGFAGRLEDRSVEALTNKPVTFHLFSSTSRSGDGPGDVIYLDPDETMALPPVRTVLKFGKKNVARAIPVELSVRLTEVGTLDLSADSEITEHRWQLQFDVRGDDEADEAPTLAALVDPERIDAAEALVRETFDALERPSPDRFWHRLTETLDLKPDEWPLPVLRRLADTLVTLPRDQSKEQERLWFDALGFFLRPGYGDEVDEWRTGEAWKVHLQGLNFPTADNRIAWWSLWQRIAGGLPAAKQAQAYYEARPFLQQKVTTKKQHKVYNRRMNEREKLAGLRALARFERLPVDVKLAVGRELIGRIKKGRPKETELWALGHVGARIPLYGPMDTIVPAAEAETWVQVFLSSYPPKTNDAGYALVRLSRFTGDRSRDLSPATRDAVHRWLRKVPDANRLRDLLAKPSLPFTADERTYFLGDSVPPDAKADADPAGIVFG